MVDFEEDDERDKSDEQDPLQPPDDIYNPAVDEEQLDEDYDTPAAPASPRETTPKLPSTHPATDSNLDFQEVYDEGITDATGFNDQDEIEDSEEARPLEPEDDKRDKDEEE